MFVYLSKKISVPDNVKLLSVEWNRKEDWIAGGGEDGVLKVLRLQSIDDPRDVLTTPLNVLSTESLSGHHSGNVTKLRWNEKFGILASADTNGILILWSCSSNNGQEFKPILIKDGLPIISCEWNHSQDKLVVTRSDASFSIFWNNGEHLLEDNIGDTVTDTQWETNETIYFFTNEPNSAVLYSIKKRLFYVMAIDDMSIAGDKVVKRAIYRHCNYHESSQIQATLYDGSGEISIKHSLQNKLHTVKSHLKEVSVLKWSSDGSVLVVAGNDPQLLSSDNNRDYFCYFYNVDGEILTTLKLPENSSIDDLSWDGMGLRIVFVIGSSMYFAYVRPSLKWGVTLSGKYLFYQQFNRCLLIDLYKKKLQYIESGAIMHLKVCGERALMTKANVNVARGRDKTTLMLFDTLGGLISSMDVQFRVSLVCLGDRYILLCDGERVSILFHTEPSASGVKILEADTPTSGISPELGETVQALELSKKYIYIGSSNSIINIYVLKEELLMLTLISSVHTNNIVPHVIVPNTCDSVIAVKNKDGRCVVVNTAKEAGSVLLERVNVWGISWQNETTLTLMEKSKANSFSINGSEYSPKPCTSTGYPLTICGDAFMFYLDILLCPQKFIFERLIGKFPFPYCYKDDQLDPSLKQELYNALNIGGVDESKSNVYQLLSGKDYSSLLFVEKIKSIKSESEHSKSAEIAVHLGKYEEAIRAYQLSDRHNLAMKLLINHNKYELAEILSAKNENRFKECFEFVGDCYFKENKWIKASQFYEKVGKFEKSAECLFISGDFEKMKKNILHSERDFPKQNLIRLILAAGMYEELVIHLERSREFTKAASVALKHSLWTFLTGLLECDFNSHQLTSIELILTEKVTTLRQQRQPMRAVELYLNIKKDEDALLLLHDLISMQEGNVLLFKKLCVLSALVEKSRNNDKKLLFHQNAAEKTLDKLLGYEDKRRVLFEDSWKKAAALHFFSLSQKLFLSGQIEASMKVALKCRGFDSTIGIERLYSFIAVITYQSNFFATCSHSFLKIDGSKSVKDAKKRKYQALAIALFKDKELKDPYNMDEFLGGNCTNSKSLLSICTRSGRFIDENDTSSAFVCPSCMYQQIDDENRELICPLCHFDSKEAQK